jgi:hypothetical protein
MPRQPLPDDVRVLQVGPFDYFIEWEELARGSSFFIPCVARLADVEAALAPARAHFDFGLIVRPRREHGMAGFRIWRTY